VEHDKTFLFEKLEKITKKMDVPDYKRINIDWLQKNLGKRNKNHPQYDEAIKIVEELASKGMKH